VSGPPAPVRRAVFTQGWTRLSYLHWPVEPAALQSLLPPRLTPDLWEGQAWVGLIPFAMRRVGILGMRPLPYLSDFLETNVRSYTVAADGSRAVFFHTLEADRLLSVLAARASYRLPYAWSRMRLVQQGDVLTYTSERRWPAPRGASSRIVVRVGDPVEATPLDDWLSARWGLHSRWWGGSLVHAPVSHEPWPLRAAELLDLDEDLIATVGLPPPVGAPRVLHSDGVHVRLGRPDRVRAGDRSAQPAAGSARSRSARWRAA